jgi:nuclear GTP-binding protein
MARTKQPAGSSPKARLSYSTGASGGVSLKRVKGENFYQNAEDARRLKLLTGGKPIRDKQGVIIPALEYQKGEGRDQAGLCCS